MAGARSLAFKGAGWQELGQGQGKRAGRRALNMDKTGASALRAGAGCRSSTWRRRAPSPGAWMGSVGPPVLAARIRSRQLGPGAGSSFRVKRH